MKQQVNLFRYLPTQRHFEFNFKMIFYAYIVFFIALLLLLTNSILNLNKQNHKLDLLTQELKSEQSKLTQLTAQYPMINPKDLQGSVQQLKKELNQRVQLSSFLASAKGFSFFFSKLAEAILPTVWLNEIAIDNSKQSVTLRGFSFQALQIQLFLDSLNQKKAFDNSLVELQNVTKIKNQKNLIFLTFEASNKTTAHE